MLLFSEQHFSPLYPKTILAFFGFILLQHIFGGEILACNPISILTHRLSCPVAHCSCPPFPASHSDEFETKALKFPLVWLHEH